MFEKTKINEKEGMDCPLKRINFARYRAKEVFKKIEVLVRTVTNATKVGVEPTNLRFKTIKTQTTAQLHE